MEKKYLINETEFQNFNQMIKDITLELFNNFIGVKSSDNEISQEFITKNVLKDKMSFILISGQSFNIVYRCFFNSSDYRKAVSISIGQGEDQITEILIQDFMKELI